MQNIRITSLIVTGIFCAFFLIINTFDLDLHIAVSEYWPKTIAKLGNPELYPDDVFSSWVTNFTSLFWSIPMAFYKYLGISPELSGRIAILIVVFLWGWSVYKISLELFQNHLSAVFAAILSLGSPLNSFTLAQGTRFIVPTVSIFVIPFLLVTLLWFLQRHRYRNFILLGLCFYVHPVFSFFILFLFVITLFFKQKFYSTSQYLLPLTYTVLIALPVLINLQLLVVNDIPKEDFMKLLFLRSSFHHFPSTFDYTNILFVLLAFVLSLKYLTHPAKHKIISIWTCGIGLLCIIGYVFVELIPVITIVKLSLFKSTQFFVIFATIYFAHYLLRTFQTGAPVVRIAVTGFLLTLCVLKVDKVALFFVLFIVNDIAEGKIFCFKTDRLLDWISSKTPETVKRIKFYSKATRIYLVSILIVALYDLPEKMILIFGNPTLTPLNQSGLNTLLLIGIVLLSAFIFCSSYVRQSFNHFTRSRACTLLLICTAAFCLLYQAAWLSKHTNRLEAQGWKNAQLWAHEHTDIFSTFIIPFNSWGWRGYSLRSTIGSWKDFDFWKYTGSKKEFDVVVERLAEYGFDYHSASPDNVIDLNSYLANQFNKFTEEQFKILGARYGANYIVTKNTKKLSFPVVYSNEWYTIYRLE